MFIAPKSSYCVSYYHIMGYVYLLHIGGQWGLRRKFPMGILFADPEKKILRWLGTFIGGGREEANSCGGAVGSAGEHPRWFLDLLSRAEPLEGHDPCIWTGWPNGHLGSPRGMNVSRRGFHAVRCEVSIVRCWLKVLVGEDLWSANGACVHGSTSLGVPQLAVCFLLKSEK